MQPAYRLEDAGRRGVRARGETRAYMRWMVFGIAMAFLAGIALPNLAERFGVAGWALPFDRFTLLFLALFGLVFGAGAALITIGVRLANAVERLVDVVEAPALTDDADAGADDEPDQNSATMSSPPYRKTG